MKNLKIRLRVLNVLMAISGAILLVRIAYWLINNAYSPTWLDVPAPIAVFVLGVSFFLRNLWIRWNKTALTGTIPATTASDVTARAIGVVFIIFLVISTLAFVAFGLFTSLH